MTTMELIATFALIEFILWAGTDITYKFKLIRRMTIEDNFLRQYLRRARDEA